VVTGLGFLQRELERRTDVSICGELSEKRVEIFFEMGAMVNYHSDLRTRLTTHFASHRAKIASFHVHTRARLVAMGVSVANLALGELITMHAAISSFNHVLDAVVQDTRTLGFSSSILSA
jgi:hypothetical protein